jgi:DNA-binding winged helix-turn-helix (wHTH) protein
MMNSGELRYHMDDGSLDVKVVTFGPFRLTPGRRRLEKDGVAIALGGRAFDILLVLLERPQQIVSKKEIFDRVWPGLHVDESSLRVHISALRKALGDGKPDVNYITNVSGRGYSFACAVTAMVVNSAPLEAGSRGTRLPTLGSEIIGRESAIKAIASH